GGRAILLAPVDGGVYAIEATCPHLGGSLAEGTLNGRHLTCPLHEATFDVSTGAVVTDPFGVVPPEGGVTPVPCFPTRVRDGMIDVDLPDAPPA
ncbi:MAG: Rieske (2Fe-2S) protein, partial [Thermoplasmata archaeon]